MYSVSRASAARIALTSRSPSTTNSACSSPAGSIPAAAGRPATAPSSAAPNTPEVSGATTISGETSARTVARSAVRSSRGPAIVHSCGFVEPPPACAADHGASRTAANSDVRSRVSPPCRKRCRAT